MPLIKGSSKKTVRRNTEKLIGEGRDPSQAYAISMDTARDHAKRKGKPMPDHLKKKR